MKVDVVCVTKNKLPNWWMKNLELVPVNNLIIERSKPLGQARMKAIQKVTTDWFLFIDVFFVVGKAVEGRMRETEVRKWVDFGLLTTDFLLISFNSFYP